jgi:hypothetical protein
MDFLGETSVLQFRAEFFNIFNRPNFGSPQMTLFTRIGAVQSGAGQIKETSVNARQAQLALRLMS